MHEAKVFYLNISQFQECFPPHKIKQLQAWYPNIDFNLVGKHIIENQEMRKKLKHSFLSAIQMNYIPYSPREDSTHDLSKKYRHWLEKAKNNQICKFLKLT